MLLCLFRERSPNSGITYLSSVIGVIEYIHKSDATMR